MKSIKLLSFLVMASIFFVGCVSTSSSAKSSLENIDYLRYENFPQPNHSSLVVPRNVIVLSIDDKYPENYNLIRPGSHILALRLFTGSYSSTPGFFTHIFEENSIYRIEYEITMDKNNKEPEYVEFFIVRDEWFESLKDFMEMNPNHLDGTWSGETKRLMNTFYIQYDFSNNRMAYEARSRHAGMRTFNMEGTIYYNADTIIFLPKKATDNGNEYGKFQNFYIWHYTLRDNILKLEGGGTAGTAVHIWETDGEFRKVN